MPSSADTVSITAYIERAVPLAARVDLAVSRTGCVEMGVAVAASVAQIVSLEVEL
jgi:hypothetical protein